MYVGRLTEVVETVGAVVVGRGCDRGIVFMLLKVALLCMVRFGCVDSVVCL